MLSVSIHCRTAFKVLTGARYASAWARPQLGCIFYGN